MQVIPETPEKDWPTTAAPSPQGVKTEQWTYTDEETPEPEGEQKITLYYVVNAVAPHNYEIAPTYEDLPGSVLIFPEGHVYIGRIRCFLSKLPPGFFFK